MSSLPGASSGRSRVRGFSPDVVRSESQEQSPRDSGMGWDKGGRGGKGSKSSWARIATERKPMREIYAKELAWAAEHLPDEHGPFVCLAIESVKRQGLKPSTQTVLAQLRATRRDSVACLERAKRYGVVAKDG